MKTNKTNKNMNYEIKEKLSNAFWKCTYLNGNVNYIMALTSFNMSITEKQKKLSEILYSYETIENPVIKSELVYLDNSNNDRQFVSVI